MKKSLGKKICAIGICFICGFVLLNILLTYFLLIPFSTYLTSEQMKKVALDIEQQQLHMDEEFTEYIENVNEDSNMQITVIDEEKKIITTSKNSMSYNNDIGRFCTLIFDENKAKLESGKSVSVTKDKDMTNRIQVILMKKIADNRYVILSRSYRSLQNATKSAILFNVVSGILMILIGSIFVYRWSRYMINPLRKMINVAENISDLNFDAKVEVESQDELGQLGVAINKMSGHLEENLVQLQEDIESRKRLVRNLSHEIKSPIAIIMGYSDRMKKVIHDNPEKALEYCMIISNESARVDMIIKEMLEISKMELGASEVNKESFEVDCLFQDIKERFKEENIGKDINYIEQFTKAEMIHADFLLMERAVYNLIQNAVLHGASECMTIRVTGERKQEFYEFKVYNSGSHIAEAEISSIWEPFSKIDKVRTRGKQGHGVGLSIVREIIEAHEGYYSVCNMEDGVEFLLAIKG